MLKEYGFHSKSLKQNKMALSNGVSEDQRLGSKVLFSSVKAAGCRPLVFQDKQINPRNYPEVNGFSLYPGTMLNKHPHTVSLNKYHNLVR